MEKKMVSRVTGMCAALAVLALASGCVVVVGDGASRGNDVEWSTAWSSSSKSEPVVADPGLAREVQSRIKLDSSLAAEDITVSSSGSVVTLHGRVSELALLEHAMRVAATVPGVSRVVSRMSVELEAS